MNAITQESLHHLIPGKMAAMAAMYAEDNNTTPLDALRHLYQNKTYPSLEREDTKLWHLGPVALFEEFGATVCGGVMLP